LQRAKERDREDGGGTPLSPGKRERDREKDREKEKDKDREGGGGERYFSNGPEKSGEAGGVEVGVDSPSLMDVKEGPEGKEGKEGKPLKDAKEGKEVKEKEGREGREDLNLKIKINTIGSPRVAAKEAKEKDVKARNKARAQVVKTVSDEGCVCVCVCACVRACVRGARQSSRR